MTYSIILNPTTNNNGYTSSNSFLAEALAPYLRRDSQFSNWENNHIIDKGVIFQEKDAGFLSLRTITRDPTSYLDMSLSQKEDRAPFYNPDHGDTNIFYRIDPNVLLRDQYQFDNDIAVLNEALKKWPNTKVTVILTTDGVEQDNLNTACQRVKTEVIQKLDTDYVKVHPEPIQVSVKNITDTQKETLWKIARAPIKKAETEKKNVEKLLTACKEYKAYLYNKISDGGLYGWVGKSFVDEKDMSVHGLALRKYNAVYDLIETLEPDHDKEMDARTPDDRSSAEKLKIFKESYNAVEYKELLAKRRDSGFIRFLKAVACIIPIPNLRARLFHVKGKALTEDIDKTLGNDDSISKGP